jgi:hypothetical protein
LARLNLSNATRIGEDAQPVLPTPAAADLTDEEGAK